MSRKRAREFDEHEEEERRQEYYDSLRDQNIKKNVIPLQSRSEMQPETQKSDDPKPAKPKQEVVYGLNIRSQQVETRRPVGAPLLSKNRPYSVSDAMSEKEILDVDLSFRPEENDIERYHRMPIEGFGTALLRGMGWKEGQSVGKNRGGYDQLI
jgi:hypothetical protein